MDTYLGAKVVGAHQHFIQPFKTRNLDQTMPKKANFLEKML